MYIYIYTYIYRCNIHIHTYTCLYACTRIPWNDVWGDAQCAQHSDGRDPPAADDDHAVDESRMRCLTNATLYFRWAWPFSSGYWWWNTWGMVLQYMTKALIHDAVCMRSVNENDTFHGDLCWASIWVRIHIYIFIYISIWALLIKHHDLAWHVWCRRREQRSWRCSIHKIGEWE